jgi:hypothetical protein
VAPPRSCLRPPPFGGLGRAEPHERMISVSLASLRRRDRLGLVLSFACLLHCLLTPLLVSLLPLFGLGLLASDSFHAVFAVGVLLAAALALIPGFRVHRRASVPALGIAGVTSVAVGAAMSHGGAETLLTVIGSLLLVAAHVSNLRHARKHLHAHPHPGDEEPSAVDPT